MKPIARTSAPAVKSASVPSEPKKAAAPAPEKKRAAHAEDAFWDGVDWQDKMAYEAGFASVFMGH